MDQEKFGKLIKEIRKKNNLTQKQFADKYNVTYQAVSKWENGLNMPDTSLIRQISKDFNISLDELLGDVSGILVPGGFGTRGIDGKLEAIKYARTHNVPFLGLCLGMQLSIVEFARDVLGYNDAHSAELDPNTTHPVIHIMPEQIGIEDIGGTLRLGAYPCVLDKTSKAYEMYGTEQISERHRHRYEVNNYYRDDLEKHGMSLCGLSPDGRIVEMCEIPSHPWFVATQAHPEFKSRPNKPHPLFKGFVGAALEYKN